MDNDKRALTDSRKKSIANFRAGAYDRIEINVPKGKKEIIKSHAAKHQPEVGEIGLEGYSPKGSVTAFINRAIDEAMTRDKQLS